MAGIQPVALPPVSRLPTTNTPVTRSTTQHQTFSVQDVEETVVKTSPYHEPQRGGSNDTYRLPGTTTMTNVGEMNTRNTSYSMANLNLTAKSSSSTSSSTSSSISLPQRKEQSTECVSETGRKNV